MGDERGTTGDGGGGPQPSLTIEQRFARSMRRSTRSEDLLAVEQDQVFYDERRHPMVLALPAFEGLSVLQVWLMLRFGAPFGLRTFLFFLTAASLIIISGWLWRDRAKWVNRALVTALVATFLNVSTVPGILFLLVVAALGRFVLRVATWARYERLYVTDRRIVQTTGVFTRKRSSMPLGRVTDASVKQTIIGEQLGYGEFILETAGQKQAINMLDFLVDVERFNELVLTMATSSKSKELPDEGPSDVTAATRAGARPRRGREHQVRAAIESRVVRRSRGDRSLPSG